MVSKKSRSEVRVNKHRKLRNRFSGTAERPRLAVFRSNNHMYLSLIHISTRSPQWTGGGVVFAPTPRDYSFKLNKKEKRAALKSALTTRVLENKFIVLDEMNFGEIKTKNFQNMLNNLEVSKALVVLEDGNTNAALSARNIANVKTAWTNTINVYDILKYNTVIVTKAVVATIEEVYA